MQRRQLLSTVGSLAALGLAGCTGSTDGPPDGNGSDDGGSDGGDSSPTETPSDTPTRTQTPGTGVESIDVTTRGGDCLSDDDEESADISADADAGRIVVRGAIEAPTPCHRAVVETAAIDDSGVLSLDVGVESAADGCQECIGIVDYEAVVSVAGPLPRTVELSHDGRPIASASFKDTTAGDSSTPTDDDSTPHQGIELESREFRVVDAESGQQRDEADIEFRTEANEVVVTGTIWGSDGCKTAHLAEATYDADEDRLSVAVATRDREDAGGGCTQAILEIDYEATFGFSNGTPGEVAVSHDGRGVASAAHGAASAGEE